jgi:hypothetical protein
MASKGTTKKTSDKNISGEQGIDPESDEQAMQMPTGKRITKTIEVRSEDLKRVEPEEPEEPEADEPEETDTAEFFDEDLISDGFFDEEGAGISFVEVYRLVGGSLRGGGKMPFVDNFPLTNTLRGDIRDACGGGKFVVVQRGPDPETGRVGILRRKTVEIEGPPKEYSPASTPQAVPAPPVAAPSVNAPAQEKRDDPLRDALESAMIRRLNRVMDEAMNPQQPALAPAAPSSPVDSLNQAFTLVEKVTEMGAKISPPQTSGDGFLNGTANVINAIGNFAGALGLKELFKPLAGMFIQAKMQQGAQQPPSGMQQPQMNAPAQMPAPDPIQATLIVLIDDLKKNKRAGRSAQNVEDLMQQLPEEQKAMLAGLVTAPPEEILAQLSEFAQEDLSQYAHALDFVRDLQAELSGDDEEEGQSVQGDFTGSADGDYEPAGAGVVEALTQEKKE